MHTVHKTYRFELPPDKEQKILHNKHLGNSRFTYNYFLYQGIEQYKKDKKSDNYQTQALVLLKKQEKTVFLGEVNNQSLQTSVRNLDTAFVNFYQGRAKFPHIKSRKHSKHRSVKPEAHLFLASG